MPPGRVVAGAMVPDDGVELVEAGELDIAVDIAAKLQAVVLAGRPASELPQGVPSRRHEAAEGTGLCEATVHAVRKPRPPREVLERVERTVSTSADDLKAEFERQALRPPEPHAHREHGLAVQVYGPSRLERAVPIADGHVDGTEVDAMPLGVANDRR